MTIVKGSSLDITATVYSDNDKKVIADITGATVKCLFKKQKTDLDVNAIITRTVGAGVVLTSPTLGVLNVALLGSDTNDLSFSILYFDIVVKLSTGKIIRTSVQELKMLDKVTKILP